MFNAVQALLYEIENELKHQQLWRNTPPDASAMASTLPFCCDTLAAEQWLQFILLPRLQTVLDTGRALPAKVSVLPYAEEAFKSHEKPLQRLLRLIGQLDITISGAA